MKNILSIKDLNNDSKKKKELNVKAFIKLHRDDLDYKKIIRRLLIKEFKTGEKIYIEYPGKESKESNPKPYDFFPRLLLTNGEFMKNLSFKDIWDDLLVFKKQNVNLSSLAAIYARMAYMADTDKKPTKKNLSYEEIDKTQNDKIIKTKETDFEWYEYNPSISLFKNLGISSELIVSNRGVTILPYLYYVDLIAQNEDCKYFYKKEAKGKKWDYRAGRRNTCLTHVSIIAYLEEFMSFSQLLAKMSNGVAPINIKDLSQVTNGRIIK